jgi:hypothetical protein
MVPNTWYIEEISKCPSATTGTGRIEEKTVAATGSAAWMMAMTTTMKQMSSA